MNDHATTLREHGFVCLQGRFQCPRDAFEAARTLIDEMVAHRGMSPVSVVGDFVLPPVDGRRTREFQTLHFDFGLPLVPKVDQDLAHFTALHVPASVRRPTAVTRLVPLAALLAQRAWPAPPELIDRLVGYGRTHGAWDDSRGYVEGSLARLVEAAGGETPVLPSVKTEEGFLCGLEFDNIDSEQLFFERLGLHIADVLVDVALGQGELLVFDNFAVAHGRRGARDPGELHQRAYGYSRMDAAGQRRVRDGVLAAFDPSTIAVGASWPPPMGDVLTH